MGSVTGILGVDVPAAPDAVVGTLIRFASKSPINGASKPDCRAVLRNRVGRTALFPICADTLGSLKASLANHPYLVLEEMAVGG
jgi:hypothetical protein